jgi:class 3 adenylate cyclase
LPHAEQAIRFCLSALAIIDEINIGHHYQLSIRIGVNTGNTVIARVLGTDKPAFDIIGDSINLSLRLQNNSTPNKIQISKNTCELISSVSDFEIEDRVEIFLKAKGKTQTYLVQTQVQPIQEEITIAPEETLTIPEVIPIVSEESPTVQEEIPTFDFNFEI